MYLSKKRVSQFQASDISPEDYFKLPEKALQFGTGVLLRGLPDYFIDKANKANVFNGRIVVVKSTDGSVGPFDLQDSLYTQCIRGIENGNHVRQNIINASISRVIPAGGKWDQILACAENPEMQLVISNTTEVGIAFSPDNIHDAPPESFPGKLLAFLYRRFQYFGGDGSKGMVIVPTELIPGNGELLLSILLRLADLNKLDDSFSEWLKDANFFCNSLVDRIVPGKPPKDQISKLEEELGYQDDLMIISEPYGLWAIEGKDKKVSEILSFSKTDSGVVIAPDINIFRELKLRLLNGSHTFSCGLAALAGFENVREAMENEIFGEYVRRLMIREIVPSITTDSLTATDALNFSKKVLDRFCNPYIVHQWLAITMQYSSKMCLRNVPILLNYTERFGLIPQWMTLGFAAHILFMKPVEFSADKYYGEVSGKKYLINDNQAEIYAAAWKNRDTGETVAEILGNRGLWKNDLTLIDGFSSGVLNCLLEMQGGEIRNLIKKMLVNQDQKTNA